VPRVAHEAIDVAERRLRGQRDGVFRLLGPEDPDQLPQLLQRLPTGLLHLAGQLRHLARVGGGHLDRAGLQDHEAHPVADDIVHLAGDPGALLEHRLAGQQLLLRLGPLRALDQRRHQHGARPGVRAQRSRQQHQEPRREGPLPGDFERVDRPGPQH
jgi:hypothetical protein